MSNIITLFSAVLATTCLSAFAQTNPDPAASSARLYWHSFLHQNMDAITIPAGCSLFPKELFRPSRRWAAARFKNITYWNELDKGGHFAAMEQPGALAHEIREHFRPLRAAL